MALHPGADILDDLHQLTVVPAVGEGVHQAGKVALPRHGCVALLQHLVQGLVHEHLGFVAVTDPEVVVQIQAVALLPEELGAESVDGGDIRFIEQSGLPAEADILRVKSHTLRQLGGDAAFQLGGGGLGKSDDQEAVDIRSLLHPAEEPLYQYPGLARAGSGGDQETAAPLLYRYPLFRCQGEWHGAPHLSCEGSRPLFLFCSQPSRSCWYSTTPAMG